MPTDRQGETLMHFSRNTIYAGYILVMVKNMTENGLMRVKVRPEQSKNLPIVFNRGKYWKVPIFTNF